MGSIKVTGAVVGGPESSGGAVFPTSQFSAQLALSSSAGKAYQAATGVLVRNVNSPSSYVALDGVGASSTVTQGDFLYLKSDASMMLELTVDDGAGGTNVEECPVQGVYLREFPTTRPLEGLRIKGSGKIEYVVSGPS